MKRIPKRGELTRPRRLTTRIRYVRFRVHQYYCLKDVALLLDVNVSTVQRWIQRGLLKAKKLGEGKHALVRVHGMAIVAFLKKAR